MIDLFATPERLSPLRRCRVAVRRFLYSVLRAVPAGVVEAVHRRWIDADGRRYPGWRPLASALFYRPISAEVITVPGGRGTRLVVAGSRMERTLWWFGERAYEGAEAAWWRHLSARAENILEIGANIGYYTVVGAAAARGTYTAVEPNPEAAAVVRRNLAANGLHRVEVAEVAAVADDGPREVELAFPDQESFSVAPTGSFLREVAEGVSMRAASRSITVPAAPASALLADRDLVKLDIEGSEAAVLEAALPEIRRSRPILLVELLHGSVRLREVIDVLVADRYAVFAMGSELRPLSAADRDVREDRDVLLVPEERVDDL